MSTSTESICNKFLETELGQLSSYQDKWERRSSIRTRPRKEIDFSLEGYFYPIEKQPLFLHSKISSLTKERQHEVLVQSFYKYLNDIIKLELHQINSACHKIIYSNLPITYHNQTKIEAFTIIIDEYYHVYVAMDMIRQLNNRYSHLRLEEKNYPVSESNYSVAEIKKTLDKKYHDIFEIIAVCIFETTLVRELVSFFNSEKVHPSVKYYVNDHMNDEARHFKFFFDILAFTWQEIPIDYRQNIGQQIADFIKLYLNVGSEIVFNQGLLREILGDELESKKIIDEMYKGFEISPEIPIVKNVLKVLNDTKILEDNSVKKGFEQIGWNI